MPPKLKQNHLVYQTLGWIFLALVFMAVVSLVYYMQVSNQPPPNPVLHRAEASNIYTNEQYGFELSVPKDWVVDTLSYKDTICFMSPATMQKVLDPGYTGICGDLVFESKSYIAQAKTGTVKGTSINGNEFTYFDSEVASYKLANYEIKRGTRTYNFYTDPGSGAEQLLSTLKFTR